MFRVWGLHFGLVHGWFPGPSATLLRLMHRLPELPGLWHKTQVTKLHSRKITWKPKKGPIQTTDLLKGGYMGFHVSLGECR